jgi:hypothetical protein
MAGGDEASSAATGRSLYAISSTGTGSASIPQMFVKGQSALLRFRAVTLDEVVTITIRG